MRPDTLNKTPDHRLVLTHYFTSGVGFFLVVLLIVLAPQSLMGHYFGPELLAITHLAVFGWITMLIFGALYQLLPVISGNDLYSEKLAYGTYGLLMAGIPFLIISFWAFSLSGFIHAGGTLIILAVLGFSYNLWKTLGNKEPALEKDFIGTSCIWLLANVILGFVLALNLGSHFLPEEHLVYLKLHAHIGGAGWFLSLIMGVGARLVPMFALAHGLDQRPLRIAYWLLQGGLIGLIVNLLITIPFLGVICWSALLGAIISYLTFVLSAYQKRMRKKLDFPMKVTFWAFAVLLIPVLIGSLITLWQNGELGPEWGILYGVTFFLGFIGLLIIGQTFKTFPFIVWMAYLQPYVTQGSTSMPQQLINGKRLIETVIIYGTGMLGLLASISLQNPLGIQISGSTLAIGVMVYNAGMYLVFRNAKKENQKLRYDKTNHAGTRGTASTVAAKGRQ